MNDHPNKHIRAAVDEALRRGWRLVKSGPWAHVWGKLYCPANVRGGCIFSIYSTPRVPENTRATSYECWMFARIEPRGLWTIGVWL